MHLVVRGNLPIFAAPQAVGSSVASIIAMIHVTAFQSLSKITELMNEVEFKLFKSLVSKKLIDKNQSVRQKAFNIVSRWIV